MEILVSKKDGDFSTIQEAVEAVPYEESAVIKIGEGVFREKVFCEKKDITFVGAGIDKTILEFDDYANEVMADGKKRGTFRSYTAFFGGKRVVVRNMTIKNTAGDGRVVGQALAVYADADVCLFENVKMTGCQDTLFCAPLPRTERQKNGFLGPRVMTERRLTKQYYKSCEITGDVDFIFGGADAVFDDCVITCNDRMHIRSEAGFGSAPCKVTGAASGVGAGVFGKGLVNEVSEGKDGVAVGDGNKAEGEVTTREGNETKGRASNTGEQSVMSAEGNRTVVGVVTGVAASLAGGRSGAAVMPGKNPHGEEHKLDKDQIDINERPINGYITAACGLKDDIGFVFRNCVIKGAPGCEPGSVFLGRPWRDEAKTVFLNCVMDECIAPERFSGWGGITKDESSTFYGEVGTKVMPASMNEGRKRAGAEVESLAETVYVNKDGASLDKLMPADLGAKNPWVKDIDEALSEELNANADEIVKMCM